MIVLDSHSYEGMISKEGWGKRDNNLTKITK